MLYRQTEIFTKFFLILHSLFLFSCVSSKNKELKSDTSLPKHVKISITNSKEELKKMNKIDYIEKHSFEFLPETQGNWKIIRQQVEYQDGFSLSSISSIWILDKDFPVELVTLDNFVPEDEDIASYSEGDKIILRSTDNFITVAEILAIENGENKGTVCNEDEFQMFARIYSQIMYTGVMDKNADYNNYDNKNSWFKFGNIVCAKIIHL